jgi:protein-tyrosine kinase
MDHIIQALERAKEGRAAPQQEHGQPPPVPRAAAPLDRGPQIPDTEVSLSRLEDLRVIAHDTADPRSRSFDLLRTQVLQAMGSNNWRVLAVTSPTAGCGKTFTAINLALSIARQPDGPVLLVDLDFNKPQVAQRLGITCKVGTRALAEGHAALEDAITCLSVGGFRFQMLPCERPSSRSSDWIASPRMTAALQRMRTDRTLKTVILDLPPLLSGDEVIAVLPYVDCVLLVAAVGTTTTVELKECAKYLHSTPLVRLALNKVPDTPSAYY